MTAMCFGDRPPVVYLSCMLPVPSLSDFRALLKLALPIVVVQVGLMMMGVVDTIIVGHVSATELACGVPPEAVYFLTQTELLRSREIAVRVIRELGLTRHPMMDPRQQPTPGWEKWLRRDFEADVSKYGGENEKEDSSNGR